MNKVLKWFVENFLGNFLAGIMILFVTIYIKSINEKKKICLSFTCLKDIFMTSMSLWIVLLIVLSVIIVFKIYIKKNSNSILDFYKAPKNKNRKYTQDAFGINKTIWTWDYKWNAIKQKFEIINLKPSCTVCLTPMERYNHYQHTYECFKCRLDGRQYVFKVQEDSNDVEKEICRHNQNK